MFTLKLKHLRLKLAVIERPFEIATLTDCLCKLNELRIQLPISLMTLTLVIVCVPMIALTSYLLCVVLKILQFELDYRSIHTLLFFTLFYLRRILKVIEYVVSLVEKQQSFVRFYMLPNTF